MHVLSAGDLENVYRSLHSCTMQVTSTHQGCSGRFRDAKFGSQGGKCLIPAFEMLTGHMWCKVALVVYADLLLIHNRTARLISVNARCGMTGNHKPGLKSGLLVHNAVVSLAELA